MTMESAKETGRGADDGSEPAAPWRGFMLALLIIVYALNFLDRQIIGILAIPIQTEMGLRDAQLGLMRGASFAIFYATLGVPVAWLADRMNRVWIISIALFFWSLMTAVCGLAQNFGQMFLARLGVGIGEAGGVAPSYSIVSDYYPKHQRARAMAVYSFGIPIGSAIGVIFGGVIATLFDWRVAFFAVGLAGVVFAPVFFLLMREPKRGRYDPPPAADGTGPARASLWDVFGVLLKKPSFFLMSFGAASSSMLGYGLFAWLPAFLVRSYDSELPTALAFLPRALVPPNAGPIFYASLIFGVITLVGGMIGIWLGGALTDRFARKSVRAHALVPGIAFVIATPLLVLGVLTDHLWLAVVIFVFQGALSLAWLGPVVSAFQMMTPVHMRTTTTAIFLLINNLVGIGLGDYLIGLISESYKVHFGDESLRYALLTGTLAYVLAAIFFVLASFRIRKDWHG